MNHFFLKTGRQEYEKIRYQDILYIESHVNYSALVTVDKTYTVMIPLKQWQEELPDTLFFKIHRSYIVAIEKITTVECKRIKLAGKELPIGRMFRDNLLKQLNIVQTTQADRSNNHLKGKESIVYTKH